MFRRLYQQFRSGKQPASLNKKFSLIAISNLNPLCCSTCTAYLMSCQMPTILLLTFCWMRPRMLSPNIKIYEKEWHTYLKPRTSTYFAHEPICTTVCQCDKKFYLLCTDQHNIIIALKSQLLSFWQTVECMFLSKIYMF